MARTARHAVDSEDRQGTSTTIRATFGRDGEDGGLTPLACRLVGLSVVPVRIDVPVFRHCQAMYQLPIFPSYPCTELVSRCSAGSHTLLVEPQRADRQLDLAGRVDQPPRIHPTSCARHRPGPYSHDRGDRAARQGDAKKQRSWTGNHGSW